MSNRQPIFGRWLTEKFIKKLNQTEWWSNKITSDDDLFVGIREGYLNVYFKGDSLAKITAGSPGAEPNTYAHWKYLVSESTSTPPDGVRKDGYLAIGSKKVRSLVYSIDQIDLIKQNAQRRFSLNSNNQRTSMREKDLIQRYLANANDVIDLEAAISTSRTQDGDRNQVSGRSSLRARLDEVMTNHYGYRPDKLAHTKGRSIPRIDLIQLGEVGGQIRLKFVEVKHIGNSDLRANELQNVSVIRQLRIYEFMINDDVCKADFLSAYRSVCQILFDLGIAKENSLASKVAKGKGLDIEPRPELLVLKNSYEKAPDRWEKHKSNIVDAGFHVEEHCL